MIYSCIATLGTAVVTDEGEDKDMVVSLDAAPEIAALRQRVHFRDDVEVTRFLGPHPRLAALLLEAAERIRHFFPVDTELALEVFEDSDDPDGPLMLYAVIESGLHPREARDRLYRFRDAWWREAASDFIGVVSLVTV
ncbi:MAG: hypothetical protein ACRDJH_02565 [Thermomicrobiales bacterium]